MPTKITIASSIADTIRDDLFAVLGPDGEGVLRSAKVFDRDWEAMAKMRDLLAPCVMVNYTGQTITSKSSTGVLIASEMSFSLYILDDTDREMDERLRGSDISGAGAGLWYIEERIIDLLAGAKLGVVGTIGPVTLPMRILGSGQEQATKDATVFALRIAVKPPNNLRT